MIVVAHSYVAIHCYQPEEIVPVEVKGRKGPEIVEHDEHPRMPDPSKIGKLPTVFKKGG